MRFLYVIIWSLLSLNGYTQDLSLYEKHYFNAPEVNLPYRLLRLIFTDSIRKYPLIVFLHGAGQKGFDNEVQFSGAGNVSTVNRFASKAAWWIFHGDKNLVVPVYFSRNYYKKLHKKGADVRYSEYTGIDHNCWANAFREPELMSWQFSKHKNEVSK